MTRSPRGSGSLRQTETGAWRIVISLPPDPMTGKRRQLTRTLHGTKTQARAALNAILAERGAGRLDGSAITVAGLVGEWLDNDLELSPTTRADYDRMRVFLRGPFGARPASKVTVAEVRELYRHLANEGVTPWRVQRLHEVLRRAFNLGMRWEWLQRNPVALAAPPMPKRKTAPVPTADDVILLLNAIGDDFATWLRVAAATGARRGEVCGLQWGDVDLEQGAVRVVRSVAYTPASGVVVKSTKTGRGRVLAIDENTARMLATHRLACVERARMVGRVLGDDAFVFATELDGSTPWRPDRATQRFVRLRNSLGLDVRLHDLRHASVTYLLGAGSNPNDVASRHGHARTSVTLDVYGHAVPVRDRQMAELVGRRLDGV